MSDGLFITGGTGFLGMEFVARMLAADDGPDLFLLVRDETRVDAMLHTLYDEVPETAERVVPVIGDLTAPGLGISSGALADLRRGVDRVVHCAASITFDLPLEEARAINLEGTRRVLDLAASLSHLEQLVHVSTAYVGGRSGTRFCERDVGPGSGFRNTYEQTKWEAEQVVSQAALPTAVVRPSIEEGDASSGWTPTFNVLYWPLQAVVRGLVRELPADPQGIVDVVPVDHVIDVLMAAAFTAGASGTYHAVAADAALTVQELVEVAAETLRSAAVPIIALSDVEAHPAGVFAPYFDVANRFDDARVREDFGLGAPALESYFDRLVGYAIDARWGKAGRSRQSACLEST